MARCFEDTSAQSGKGEYLMCHLAKGLIVNDPLTCLLSNSTRLYGPKDGVATAEIMMATDHPFFF